MTRTACAAVDLLVGHQQCRTPLSLRLGRRMVELGRHASRPETVTRPPPGTRQGLDGWVQPSVEVDDLPGGVAARASTTSGSDDETMATSAPARASAADR